MWCNLKDPPSVLIILLPLSMFDYDDKGAKNNWCKVAIPSEFFINIPSPKDKISCTLVSLIMHDDNSLDCGHFISDVFDFNSWIWWHCDNDNISQICCFPNGVYTRDSHKQKDTKKKVILGSEKLLLMVYIRANNLISYRYVFDKEFSHISEINHMKEIVNELSIFRR